MTLPRLLALQGYWMKTPPVHIAVSALLGGGKSNPPSSDNEAKRNTEQLIRDLQAAGGSIVLGGQGGN